MGVDVSVLSSYQGTYTPITGVNTYLFTGAGAYMGKTLASDVSGIVTYDLPEREYKVRGDYLGYQWFTRRSLGEGGWTDSFTWVDSEVVIPEGEVTITVTDSGIPADGVNVYVFTSGGTYMGLYASTDVLGDVSFLLPADGGNSTNYNGYKFRADYAGAMVYSDPILVTADVDTPVSIEVGGSAALSPRHRVPASPRLVGEEIQVASLYLLPGLLAQFSNSAIADSNGEHLYFYHSDHLGTPLFLTDTDGVVVWRGEYLPFGEVFTEDTDPDGDGVEVEQPFRFPGQYEDVETGLYYNYFRDYDPQIGRYIEADPIGLAAGVNVYVYVEANPLSKMDNYGLNAAIITPVGPLPIILPKTPDQLLAEKETVAGLTQAIKKKVCMLKVGAALLPLMYKGPFIETTEATPRQRPDMSNSRQACWVRYEITRSRCYSMPYGWERAKCESTAIFGLFMCLKTTNPS